MVTQIRLGDIVLDVVKKDIKNIHLSVYPPSGRVRISAPLRMRTDTIRIFAIAKLDWIRQQQKKLREQERETRREYIARESHYVWGKRYLLQVVECAGASRVELTHSCMRLWVRPGADEGKRQMVMEDWYRTELKTAVPVLLAKWQPMIGVRVEQFFVQRMKTKWGSCNPNSRTIRLNTELAKKPRQCLEYVVVHELLHLLERHHNERFQMLMDRFIPQWRVYRDELNRAPVGHEDWTHWA